MSRSVDLRDVTTAPGSPDQNSPRPVLGARPGNQNAPRLNTMALGSTPPGLPKAVESMRRAPDTSQVRRVDALLENVWPQVEEEGLNRSCLSRLFDDDGDVPLEPCPQGTIPERCNSGMDQLPQRCPGSRGDIRELARDTPLTPVTSKKTMSSPPLEAKNGQALMNEAESLQRCAQLHQRTDRIAVPVVIGVPTIRKEATDSSRHTPTPEDNPKDARNGAPCTSTPCKSSMPSEMRESTSIRKEESTTNSTPQQQQKQNGSGGGDVLLAVHYREGEQPMSEILRLEGGQGLPVIVEAVAVGSKAARAGVAPGYALVTMNGRNEFMQLPGWQVRLLLEAPITLGFDPAPQPLRNQVGMCTEIRLKRIQESIGVPPKVAVCGPKDHGMLAEEVVFKPGSAPLFIKSGKSFSESHAGGGSLLPTEGNYPLRIPPAVQSKKEGPPPYIYELRHRDAQVLVGRAVHGARAVVGSTLEVECIVDQGVQEYRNSWRALSPTAYCSLDFVAECVNSQEDAIKGHSQAQPPRQFVFHRASGRGTSREGSENEPNLKQPACINVPGTSPKTSPRGTGHSSASRRSTTSFKVVDLDGLDETNTSKEGIVPKVPELTTADWSRSHTSQQASPRPSVRAGGGGGTRCGCGPEEDEDNWLNFHSSRSPLRWLAPVLEPVMRAFSPSRSPSRTMPSKTDQSPRHSPRNTGGKQNIFAGMTSNGTREDTTDLFTLDQFTGVSTASRVIAAPVLGPAPRRGRDETITPIFSDVRPPGVREKGLAGQVNPNQGMQPATGSKTPSRTAFLGGPVRNVHSLSGPRSRSPVTRVPAGDTSIDLNDYEEACSALSMEKSIGTPVLPPARQNGPSFSVSWNNDMLNDLGNAALRESQLVEGDRIMNV